MLKSNICLDIDGTVADFYPVMRTAFLDNYNIDIMADMIHTTTNIGIAKEEFDRFLNYIIRTFSHRIKPYDYTYDSLLFLQKYSQIPIIFITARSLDVSDVTDEWIKTNFPDLIYELYFVRSSLKAEFLVNNNYFYWVDDYADICEQCALKSINTFLINRPWNVKKQISNSIIRINTINEIKEHI